MKVHMIAGLLLGFSLVGVFATDDDNITTTISHENVTTTSSITTVPAVTTPTIVTTTTVMPTTPIPNPPDVNDPEMGTWMVKTTNNATCIRLDAAIQFQFTYEREDEKNVTTKLNVPSNATVNHTLSSCESNVIYLTFHGNSFSLTFVEEEEEKKVIGKQATISYIVSDHTFPGAPDIGQTKHESADNLTLFKVSLGKSYLCKAGDKINFGKSTIASLTMVQVEAFKNSTSGDFSSSEECTSDEKINDIVPIAVGCALALLVIIVLIAYLVGRQRTRQSGYQSV